MMSIEYPANVNFISSILKQVINFDLLSPDDIGEVFFDESLSSEIDEYQEYQLN